MKTMARCLEIPALLAVPAVLIVCASFRIEQTAILCLVVVLAALFIFFIEFEASRPSLRQIMPPVVLGALAAAGRVLFAAYPDVKPVTAICIISGLVFGPSTGFMTGALGAFVSDFFFGQGAWTPWQMYAWGMVGYFAGLLGRSRLFMAVREEADSKTIRKRHRWQQVVLCAFGALAAYLYGFILNTWTVVGFVQPLTWQSALLTYAMGFPFDTIHAISTVVFLMLIMVPWRKKLERIKLKFALAEHNQRP